MASRNGADLANKYGARKTVVDGITFDSAAEALRYRGLCALVKIGAITDVQVQPVFVLAEGVKLLEAIQDVYLDSGVTVA